MVGRILFFSKVRPSRNKIMNKINIDKLKAFKIHTSKVGYESENPKYKVKESDGSETITFESGDWKFHDNYFGGEPYGGRTVIFYKEKPVHITVYYGWVDKGFDADEVYVFLRKSLRASKDDEGFRGPERFKDKNYIYKNDRKGDIENFSGRERIYDNSKLVYEGMYAGGLVDQRKDD